jgi:hypothetical protein
MRDPLVNLTEERGTQKHRRRVQALPPVAEGSTRLAAWLPTGAHRRRRCTRPSSGITVSSYGIIIVRNATGTPDTVVNDSGSYTVSGSSWSQTSADPAVPSLTGSATLTNQGGTEIPQVNVSAEGTETHSFWTRPE